MEYRICEPLEGFAGMFKIEEIPDIQTQYFVVCPLLVGEIDLPLLEALSKRYPGKICMDIQGFLRKIEGEKIFFCRLSSAEQERILSQVNILKVDHAEAEALTGTKDLEKAARKLLTMGPKEILLSHEKGISIFVNGASYSFPWKYKQLKGRTGRGDTAFITYVSSRITKPPEEALKFAVALTSLKLERPGPFTLPLNLVDDLIKNEFY